MRIADDSIAPEIIEAAQTRYFQELPPRTLKEYGYYPIHDRIAIASVSIINSTPKIIFDQAIGALNDASSFKVAEHLYGQYQQMIKSKGKENITFEDISDILFGVVYLFDSYGDLILPSGGVFRQRRL